MNGARLKLMLFSHICSGTHITGAEKLLLFFASELKQGHDCVLVVPNEGLLSAEARARQIPTIVVPYTNFYEMYAPGPYFQEALDGFIRDGKDGLEAIINVLLEYRPDVVINNTCVNLLPVWAAKALGIPVGWMITEQIQANPYTSMPVQLIRSNSDWIIGISNATMQPFRGEGADDKIRIMYPSWNEEELQREMWSFYRSEKRREIGWDESIRVIGYVTSDIYPNKGLEHFIQMAVELAPRHPDTCYMAAGKVTDEVYYNKCLQLIKSAGLASRFFIHPFEMQIQKLYPSMDLLVIPSLIEEGFGMTALEGLIFGKTVVSYSAGGLNEIMLLTGNGSLLVEKGNIQGLVRATESLLSGGGIISSLGERNGMVVQNAFGIGSYRLRVTQWLNRVRESRMLLGPAPLPEEALGRRPAVMVRGAGPAVYLLERGYKYLFADEAVFQRWGGSFEQILNLQEGHLAAIPLGGELTSGSPAQASDPGQPAVKRKAKRHIKRWRKKGAKGIKAHRRRKASTKRSKRHKGRLSKRRAAGRQRIRSVRRRKKRKV